MNGAVVNLIQPHFVIATNMPFLPEGYKSPEGNYSKFKVGENTFRVLGSAITGYEYWNTDNKPVRLKKEPVGVLADARVDEEGSNKPKHFWMFPVWNYDAEKVQIMEITQKGIQDAINALVKNTKWGDPTGYDITVTREGSGFDTTYQVMPNPHSAIAPEITEAFKALNLHLEAVFTGGDPFAPDALDKAIDRATGNVASG